MARLGDLLVQAGAITSDQLQQALRAQRDHGGRLGTHLVEMGFLSESALARTLSVQLRIPAVSAAALDQITPEILALLPREHAERWRAVPLRLDGPHLWVAMSDPTDTRAVADLERAARRTVRAMVAPDLLVSYALERHYGVSPRRRKRSATQSYDLSRSSIPPVPFDDPYSPEERAEIDARAVDLDLRSQQLPPVVAAPKGKTLPAVSAVSQMGRFGLGALGARLAAATSQHEVFEAALAFLQQDFGRVVVLVLRSSRFVGFLAAGRGVREDALHDFSSTPGEIPILGRAVVDGRTRLGRASAATLGGLVPVLGQPGDRPVLVLPARCGTEPVGVIVAIEGRDAAEGAGEEYAQCAQRLDWALQIVSLRKRLTESIA